MTRRLPEPTDAVSPVVAHAGTPDGHRRPPWQRVFDFVHDVLEFVLNVLLFWKR